MIIIKKAQKNYFLTRISTNQNTNSHEFVTIRAPKIRANSCQKGFFRNLLHIRGLSALEYCVLLAIIAGALIASQVYIKRAIQGRWKEAVDELGPQYEPGPTTDPLFSSSSSLLSSSNTYSRTQRQGDETSGYYTMRIDTTNSIENRVETRTLPW